MSDSLRPHRLHSPWYSPGQNTGVGSRSLLQAIFPTQGSNLGLPHCGQILYQLSHKGSPRILEWMACSFSSRSSWPRNWTRSLVQFLGQEDYTYISYQISNITPKLVHLKCCQAAFSIITAILLGKTLENLGTLQFSFIRSKGLENEMFERLHTRISPSEVFQEFL